MAKVKIQGNASGTGVLTVTAPNTSTDRTITLPDATGTLLNSDGDGSNLTGISSVGGATGVDFNDNTKARFGTGNDLEIYHDGSNSIIHDNGTGDLLLRGDNVKVMNAAGTENKINIVSDGLVRLFYDNVTKFETTSTGVAVTGGVAIGGTGADNTLDDYEEGTWTPTVVSGTGISMGTIHENNYTKIGRVVTLCASFNLLSSSSPGSGGVRIGGFPFSINEANEMGFPINMNYNYKVTPSLFVSASGWLYYQNTTVGGNNLGEIGDALDASQRVSLTFSYIT